MRHFDECGKKTNVTLHIEDLVKKEGNFLAHENRERNLNILTLEKSAPICSQRQYALDFRLVLDLNSLTKNLFLLFCGHFWSNCAIRHRRRHHTAVVTPRDQINCIAFCHQNK